MKKTPCKLQRISSLPTSAGALPTRISLARNSGFTLIELLAVIAIIALLTTIVLGAVTSARLKARDTERMDNLHQVAVSLESYFNEHGGHYPTTEGNWWGTCAAYGSHDRSGPNGWVPDLAPDDIRILPLEGQQPTTATCYLYRSDGTDYKLLAHQTVEYDCPVNPKDALFDPVRDVAPYNECTYQISTPGGAGW